MANSGAVKVGDIYHLVCSREGPFKAHCGQDLYAGGKPSLLVGAPYQAKECETCIVKDNENDEASYATYTLETKNQSNKELLEEVYEVIGVLNSDTMTGSEYDDYERRLKISQTELNVRLTACGFLSKGA